MRRAVFLLVVLGVPWVLGVPRFAVASGHGPVFGLATPTNSQGEWSFDEGIFGRSTSLGSQASIRELLGYGFTPHLTVFGRIDNLTNEHYSEVHQLDFIGQHTVDSGFPALGRALYAGVKLRF